MENDLEFLREQLSQLDEPELPPTLTAEALFARLDEGTLTLPEEEPAPEEPERKAAVIPWAKLARRWAPLAACLALVLLLHQGYQVGLARNFTGNSAAPAASGAPQAAAYDLHNDTTEAVNEDIPEEKENASFSNYAEDAPESPAEDLERQKAVNAPVSSAAAAPAPVPQPEEVKGPPSGSAIGGSDDHDNSDSAGSDRPVPAPEPDHRPNPPTGGGDLNPDSGGGNGEGEGEGSVRPPIFDLDSGENGPAIYKQIIRLMEEVAEVNSPDYTLDYRLVDVEVTAKDLLMFEVVYTDGSGKVCYRMVYYCFYFEGMEGPWLKLTYAESLKTQS